MDALDEALKEFLVESHENLGQLDLELVALEKAPTARTTIASIFRKVHTLKGSAGFLGFPRLEALAHGGESLLSKLRDGKLAVTAEIITALLSLVDAVRDMLSAVEDTGQDGPNDHAPLLKSLARLREARPAPVTEPGSRSIACEAPPPQADLEQTTRLTPAHDHAASAPLEHDEADVATPAQQVVSAISDNTIRLDIGRLDKLMNLVSELVLARNQIFQHPAARSDPRLAGASRQLNLVTSELQEEVMAARMQPIGNIWGKFPRVVRDLATSCGKRVNLELQGWAPHPFSPQALHPAERPLEDPRRPPVPDSISQAQSARLVPDARRNLRHHFPPERVDLFRYPGQVGPVRPSPSGHRPGRLPRARRRRVRARSDPALRSADRSPGFLRARTLMKPCEASLRQRRRPHLSGRASRRRPRCGSGTVNAIRSEP